MFRGPRSGPRIESQVVRGLRSPGPEVEASNENHTRNGEVAKRLGNGLQNRHTRVRIPSSPRIAAHSLPNRPNGPPPSGTLARRPGGRGSPASSAAPGIARRLAGAGGRRPLHLREQAVERAERPEVQLRPRASLAIVTESRGRSVRSAGHPRAPITEWPARGARWSSSAAIRPASIPRQSPIPGPGTAPSGPSTGRRTRTARVARHGRVSRQRRALRWLRQ